MASLPVINAGAMSDAQARNLVIRALRRARAPYRAADTAGEIYEREIDRLITRKTRINASSLNGLLGKYRQYNAMVDAIQKPLTDAINAAANF